MSVEKVGHNLYEIDVRVNSGKNKDKGRVRRKINGTKETVDRIILDIRTRALAGLFGWPDENQATISDVCKLVIQDYKDNNRKSIQDAIEMGRMWEKLCGSMQADKVHEDNFKAWAREWVEGGLSHARCNRRIAFLRRGYHLATRTNPKMVKEIPAWSNLKEPPPRSGFLEWPEFKRLRGEIAEHARHAITIGYWLGMRDGEVHGLRWDQIRFDDHNETVHFHLSDSKSGKPRSVFMRGDLYRYMKDWHEFTQKYFPDCKYVCHLNGVHCVSIRTAWLTACVRVGLGRWTKPDEVSVGKRGYKGLIIHDLRRTAVRNFDRAGVRRKTAMGITGHETEAMYGRYRIVSESEMLEAGEKVIADHEKRTRGQERVSSKARKRKKPR